MILNPMASASGTHFTGVRDDSDELSRRDELDERLRWLINLRWVALIGVCLSVAGARYEQIVVSPWPLVWVVIAMAVLNLGFFGLHAQLPPRTLRALSAEALMQSGVDVVGLGLLIFFAGGLSNPFVFFFTFHVVIAAILLERRQAYTVALLTTGVVFLLGLVELLGVNTTWALQGALAPVPLSPLARFGLVFALGTTLLISVYMVTAIMDRLRAHSRDIRRLNADLADRVEKLAAAEKKLAIEHHRVRAILECMEEGVVVVDLQGKVLLANTAAQQTALLALDDTLAKAGCRDEDLENCPRAAEAAEKGECPLGNPAECLQDALAKGGKLCPATLALLGADPPKTEAALPSLTPPKSPALTQIQLQERRFENTVSAVTSGNETVGLVIVSRDVTPRHLLERQVVHAEKLHALGNLAAGVAHELNTPLGTILGYAQMLLDDVQKESSPRELRAIEDQARRCRRIVQGLLDFARKSSGGREECLPNELAAKIRDLIAHALELRGIGLKLDLCEPAPPKILVAANEIEQVLVNLITNAADAIEMAEPVAIPALAAEKALEQNAAGARHFTRSAASAIASNGADSCVIIQTRFDSGAGEVMIAVEDNGPGVPAELAEQIFEPFFTTKAAGRGTGLGLSIARRIVEDHNGRLLLTARRDGQPGARFEMRLRTPPRRS